MNIHKVEMTKINIVHTIITAVRKLKVMTLTGGVLVSAPIYVHSGHDHQTADAGLIHLLWLIPIIVSIAVIIYQKIKSQSG